MSDYTYEIIKEAVMEWYEHVLSSIENTEKIIFTKNSSDAMLIDFDFQNCIAQLSVTNSLYVPYQFIFFEAVDINTSKSVYCFFDDHTMQKKDVLVALNKALEFCTDY